MRRTTQKNVQKSSSKKTKYKFDTKNNNILEMKSIMDFRGEEFFNSIKVISDPKEPFFKETIKE